MDAAARWIAQAPSERLAAEAGPSGERTAVDGEEPSTARNEWGYWPNLSGILVTMASERTSPVAHMWV